MKQFKYIFAAALVLAAACGRVAVEEQGREVVIMAEGADNVTRTQFDEDYNLVWSSGDAFAVFSGADVLNFIISDEYAGKERAAFSGKANGDLRGLTAFYPAASSAAFHDGSLFFSLPAVQAYCASGPAQNMNPMVGRVVSGDEPDSYRALFQNVCGILMLQLTGDVAVKSIEITDGGGRLLSGNASIDTSSDAPVAVISDGSGTVKLDCGDGVMLDSDIATPFCVVVPAGSFAQGFTAKVITSAGESVLATSKAQTIYRSQIRRMAACQVKIEGALEFGTPTAFNVENNSVRYYMENATSNFTSSILSNTDSEIYTKYLKEATGNASISYWPDQPNVNTIIYSKSGASSVKVTLATDRYFTDGAIVLESTVSTSSFTFSNLVPGTTYYYKVVNASDESKVLAHDCFTATGLVRMIKVDSGWNIRDLGGWPGWGGKTVRYEKIYRGGSPGGVGKDGSSYSLSSDDYDELQRIGIKAHLDLRNTSATGASESGDYKNLYSFGYSGMSWITGDDFAQISTEKAAVNGGLSNPAVIGDVAFIIKKLKEGKPVYFNCRVGCDRTGSVAMAVLGLLGCGNDDVKAANGGNPLVLDYELSTFRPTENTVVTNKRGSAYLKYYNNRRVMKETVADKKYQFFYDMVNMSGGSYTLDNFQDKIYYYLNRYFIDNNTGVNGSTTLAISKTDLDWFVNYMLGTESFSGPSWASDNTPMLEENISRAIQFMCN